MPYYWRPQRYRRRHRYFPRRRTRRLIRRRFIWPRRRTRYFRRRYWVRRNFKRKLLKIRLNQYQPRTIRKCLVKGKVCLFQGSMKRAMFNYTQYMYSITPEEEPGGGGYAILVESLGSLWEDFEHLRNIWTTSNAGLPLVKYLGCTLYFYQTEDTDYCVEISRCLPMKDYKYTHADTAPNRMMLKRNTIKIPSRITKRKRKPYKKVRVKPPTQMTNQWYFQKDICDIPLVMVNATAVDLTRPFGSNDWQSNNVTIKCLNPQFWQRNDFQGISATVGYFPKPNTYMYTTGRHETAQTKKITDVQWIYLGNTKDHTMGVLKNASQLKTSSLTDWGNPFMDTYLNPDEASIYLADQPPSGLKTETTNPTTLTLLSDPLIIHCRYNPERDKGENNQIYIVPNTQWTSWDPPTSSNLVLSGFPIYDIMWGYVDWQEKIHEAQKILDNYIFVMTSDVITPKLTAYIPLDDTFITGYSAYKTPDSHTKITNYDKQHWQPRVKNQLDIMNTIALTGQSCPRAYSDKYLQAQMGYIFYFKWGGCPKTLEKPYDPCSQPTWNIPRNLSQTIQIENPGQNPETQLQNFDWRRDYVKESAIERIKKHTGTDEPLQLFTESRHNVPPQFQLQETSSSSSETETEEETEAPLQTQILNLRKQQHKLKRRILKRLKVK
nr:MAG: ORF1 [TTV-like mini virus]